MEDRRNSTVVRRKAICSNCRKRKSKCDSRQPQCSTCLAHNSQCQYDKPPSLAYVRSLEARIEALLLERNANVASDSRNAKEGNKETTASPSYDAGRPAASPLRASSLEDISELSGPSYQNTEARHESQQDCDRWVSQISIDSQGGVSYHNPTSVFHEAASPDNRTGKQTSDHLLSSLGQNNAQQSAQIRHSLASNAAAQKRLEALALDNMATDPDEVSSALASDFLKFHWSWIHPMFMFVYRPAFTRDMALNSTQPETPYYSETLLKVLLAHSARFLAQDTQHKDAASVIMGSLTQQAHFSLAMQVAGSSSIPTVQALLQQSAREIAFGNGSQAWLYSGMAFRIAIDLGIHLPSEKLRGYVRNLSAEDIEIRKRLFWGCYTWDKAMSLYLGRMPAFMPAMESNEPLFMDDFTEHELWEPYYGSEIRHDGTMQSTYPPHKGYMISCFTALCKLSTILGTIMLQIYGSSTESRMTGDTSPPGSHGDGAYNPKNSAFIRISSSIDRWWVKLPNTVRLDIKNPPNVSPPLHIVSLNLLYHTTLILLHRPFIIGATSFQNAAVSRSYQICIAATASIHDLLVLLISTFGYGHTTYLNCYNTYVAATIAVLHFELQESTDQPPVTDVAAEKLSLKFFLGVLQKSAKAMPGLNRSVEIVKRHMQSILDRRAKQYLDSLFPDPDLSTAHTGQSMPPQTAADFEQRSQGIPCDIAPAHLQSIDSFNAYSGFYLEGLPAFPGQNFDMGIDFNVDQEILDPQLRATCLGLDPHLTLHHENSDWIIDDLPSGYGVQ